MSASPYKRGADDGITFAIYLTVLFFASIFSPKHILLSVSSLVLMAGVPFMIYYYLRRAYVADKGIATVSSLWMHGIMIFVCGSVLSAVVQVVYLRWIDPLYISNMVKLLIDTYSKIPGENAREIVTVLQRTLDYHLLPSAISIVFEMIWLAIFSGSLLSLLMTLLVRARPVKLS